METWFKLKEKRKKYTQSAFECAKKTRFIVIFFRKSLLQVDLKKGEKSVALS